MCPGTDSALYPRFFSSRLPCCCGFSYFSLVFLFLVQQISLLCSFIFFTGICHATQQLWQIQITRVSWVVGQSTRFVEMSSQDSHPDRLRIGSALSDRSSDCFLCVALIGLVIWKKVNIFLSRVYVLFVPQLLCHYLCNSGCQNPFWSETDLVPFFCRSELFTGSPF